MQIKSGKIFKRFMPRTLFGRSLLMIVLPVLLLQIIVTFVFFDRHWTTMTNRLAGALAGDISFVANEIEKYPNLKYEEIMRDASEHLNILLSFEEGLILENIPKQESFSIVEPNLVQALEDKVTYPFIVQSHVKDKWFEIHLQLADGVLHILSPQYRLYSSSTYIFLLWMLGSSIVLVIIAILFLRNQIRPIRRLAMAADRFGRGVDVPSFKPEGALEVRQAATAFLDMKERIQRAMEQRTAMLAGISHDLRTALTRMKLQLEMLGDTPDAEALKDDIAEMQQMVEGYLAFARGEGDEKAESVDLGSVLERTAVNARRNGREVNLVAADNLFLRVKPQALERAITNLVSNAAKYGDKIWIQAYRQSNEIEITIDDDGPGIPNEKLAEVFKPFYRVETSRNPKTGGIGLGLSIAQDIIHSHGGKLILEQSNRGGLRAVIRLPA